MAVFIRASITLICSDRCFLEKDFLLLALRDKGRHWKKGTLLTAQQILIVEEGEVAQEILIGY
jgi:hypothetical protein